MPSRVNFVLSRCERIPLSIETSERFLSVDGSGKRVVRLAFDDENINKRILLVLFKFNVELNGLVSAIGITKKLNSVALIAKYDENVIKMSEPVGWTSTVIHHPFSSKSHIKILTKTGPRGDPMVAPLFWS